MEDSSKSFLKGVVIGGLVGAGIALLLAPKSGKELRGDIKRKSEEIKDSTIKGAKSARAAAAHLVDDAVKKAEQVIHDAQEKAVDMMNSSGMFASESESTSEQSARDEKSAHNRSSKGKHDSANS
jgi:gas vesicle protein